MTESFAQPFEESLASQRIRPGQILTGRVIEVGTDKVVVSAGLKSEAVIDIHQFKNERGEVEVKVGAATSQWFAFDAKVQESDVILASKSS